MKATSGIVFLALAAAVSAEELPRKTKAPRESYPNVDVIYDSVTMPDGKRLRSIVTKPRDAKGKLPVIFLAGWLSCDSVEATADTKDATGLILRGLAQTPGFCLFKIDKPGCGDSEGDCSQTDFDTELAGYRAAFRALKNHDFIDSDRVYIFWFRRRNQNRRRCAATSRSVGGSKRGSSTCSTSNAGALL